MNKQKLISLISISLKYELLNVENNLSGLAYTAPILNLVFWICQSISFAGDDL